MSLFSLEVTHSDMIIVRKMFCCALQAIPERVFVALDCLLGDSNGQVQRAAAITLYALERPTERVRPAPSIFFIILPVRPCVKGFLQSLAVAVCYKHLSHVHL